MFVYVHCYLSVPDEIEAKFSHFPPTLNNMEDTKSDIGEKMKTYAEENDLEKQLQRLTNGKLIIPIFNFYMDGSWTTLYEYLSNFTIHTA